MTDERARALRLLETLIPREPRASDCILRLLQVLGVYNRTQKT